MLVSDARPTERELTVWSHVESVLKYANSILYELHQYKGASNEIRDVSTLSLCAFALTVKKKRICQILQDTCVVSEENCPQHCKSLPTLFCASEALSLVDNRQVSPCP